MTVNNAKEAKIYLFAAVVKKPKSLSLPPLKLDLQLINHEYWYVLNTIVWMVMERLVLTSFT